MQGVHALDGSCSLNPRIGSSDGFESVVGRAILEFIQAGIAYPHGKK